MPGDASAAVDARLQEVKEAVKDLRKNAQLNTDFIEAVQVLKTYTENLIKYPKEKAFRNINWSNPHLQPRLTHLRGALEAVEALGFRQSHPETPGQPLRLRYQSQLPPEQEQEFLDITSRYLKQEMDRVQQILNSQPFRPLETHLWAAGKLVRGAACFGEIGMREEMEDDEIMSDDWLQGSRDCFFGVYDGHGGRRCVEFTSQTLHQHLAEQIRSLLRLKLQLAKRAALGHPVHDDDDDDGFGSPLSADPEAELVLRDLSDSATHLSSNPWSEDPLPEVPEAEVEALLRDGEPLSPEEVEWCWKRAYRQTDMQFRRLYPLEHSGTTTATCIIRKQLSRSQIPKMPSILESKAERERRENSSTAAQEAVNPFASDPPPQFTTSQGSNGAAAGGDAAAGSGATEHSRWLYVANVGDARAILIRGGHAIRLTLDHKPGLPVERLRVEREGGMVHVMQDIARVVYRYNNELLGGLAVSRALGDVPFKMQRDVVTCIPFTTAMELTEEDDMLLLACDGVWDVMTDQEAADFVMTRYRCLAKARVERDSAAQESAVHPDTQPSGPADIPLPRIELWRPSNSSRGRNKSRQDRNSGDSSQSNGTPYAAANHPYATMSHPYAAMQGPSVQDTSMEKEEEEENPEEESEPILTQRQLNCVLEEVSRQLCHEAINRHSSDNVTVMCVKL